MPFIAFLGCDGSGKSAVIQAVAARLEAEGNRVKPGHWRPKPFNKSSSSQAADNPHGQHPRGFASSILKLGWLWLSWWVAWCRGLHHDSRHGYLLFDRYHGDLLVDPKRYRYGGPMWLARIASRNMPQPDRVIFLDADPAVLLSRKQEVGLESLITSRSAYLAFARSNPRVEVVDASRPLAEVIESAVRIINSM
jgi:thymidylate kinase